MPGGLWGNSVLSDAHLTFDFLLSSEVVAIDSKEENMSVLS